MTEDHAPSQARLSIFSDSVPTVPSGEEQADIEEMLAKAPEIKDTQLAAFVAALQAKIDSLQKEIEHLKSPPIAESPPTTSKEISKPPIQDLIGKLHTHATEHYGTRPRSDITTIVIHHSAAPPTVGPEQIAAYHVNRHGWPGAGYHFIVAREGVIYQANTLETISYHAAKANPRSVGICFLGNFEQEPPPPAQLLAGAHLVAWLMKELNVDLDEIKGHKELMGTACPGNQWLLGKNWKEMLQQGIRQIQQGGQEPDPIPTTKSLDHYVLFWAKDGRWAQADWLNAQDYIGRFRPSNGFSAEHASLAEYVTIVGGPLGVSQEVEDRLEAQGCKVERIAGRDEAETKQMLDALVAEGRRFKSFEV